MHDALLHECAADKILERRGDPVRLRTAEGSHLWVVVSTRLTQVADQPVLLCVTRDDTAFRALEHELRKSLRKYEALAIHTPDIVTLHDFDATLSIRHVSEAGVTLLGQPREDLLKCSPYDLIHEADLPEAKARHDEARAAQAAGAAKHTTKHQYAPTLSLAPLSLDPRPSRPRPSTSEPSLRRHSPLAGIACAPPREGSSRLRRRTCGRLVQGTPLSSASRAT